MLSMLNTPVVLILLFRFTNGMFSTLYYLRGQPGHLDTLLETMRQCRSNFRVVRITWRWPQTLESLCGCANQKAVRGCSARKAHLSVSLPLTLTECHCTLSHVTLPTRKPWTPISSKKGAMPLLTSKRWQTSWTEGRRRPGEGEK